MGQILIDNSGYCPWPNYLHKVIKHVQEKIQHEDRPGIVGGLSGEGNEVGNMIFHHFSQVRMCPDLGLRVLPVRKNG